MKQQIEQKSSAQMIIAALLTGDDLMSRDISHMVLKKEGREIKIQDVASMLSKLSNPHKSKLGYFIQKNKKGNSFSYRMVEDALVLTEKQAYEITLKVGKDRYTLEKALNDFPNLNKYVSPGAKSEPKAESQAKPKPKATKGVVKKAAKKVSPAKPVKPKKTEIPPEEMIPKDQQGMDAVLTEIIRKVSDLGGLDLNVKLTVKVGD